MSEAPKCGAFAFQSRSPTTMRHKHLLPNCMDSESVLDRVCGRGIKSHPRTSSIRLFNLPTGWMDAE